MLDNATETETVTSPKTQEASADVVVKRKRGRPPGTGKKQRAAAAQAAGTAIDTEASSNKEMVNVSILRSRFDSLDGNIVMRLISIANEFTIETSNGKTIVVKSKSK